MKIRYPLIIPLGNNWYELGEDYSYVWEYDGKLYKILVKEGFQNNLASVPRVLWWYISPFDLGPAVIPHDLIYKYGGYLPPDSFFVYDDTSLLWTPINKRWSRRNSDRLLFRMIREFKVDKLKRRRSYKVVRALGWWTYFKNARKYRKLTMR